MNEELTATKVVLGSIGLSIMLLGWLARKYPGVACLRSFDLRARLSDAQRRRLQRTANVSASAQLCLLGVALPFGYILLKAMFLSEFTSGGIALVAAGSLVCIAAGVAGIVTSLRQ